MIELFEIIKIEYLDDTCLYINNIPNTLKIKKIYNDIIFINNLENIVINNHKFLNDLNNNLINVKFVSFIKNGLEIFRINKPYIIFGVYDNMVETEDNELSSVSEILIISKR